MDDLARLLLEQGPNRPVRIVYGVATAANTVAIAGSAVAVELPYITAVTTNDYVAVLECGADRLILGPVTQP